MRLIIDSHLDLAWNAVDWDRDLTVSLDEVNRQEAGMKDDKARAGVTTTFPEMRRGGIALCLATVLSRDRAAAARPEAGAHRISLDHATAAAAYATARGQLEYYHLMVKQGHMAFLVTASDVESHWRQWQGHRSAEDDTSGLPVGMVLAMEGADPIVNPEHAQDWWDLGLRSVNLVHYGRNRYAVGTGDSGPLTEDGRKLLAEFERLGMILDVTHLCDESFFEALDVFSGPVLASHNNCRELVPGDRQFSDEQIRLLVDRGAVIGSALDAWMLHAGWKIGSTSREAVSLDAVADHIDHICQIAGNTNHVAIGSDLDGGFGTEQVPTGLDSIADLQKLEGILATRGYDNKSIDAVFHENWLRFLVEHLPG